MFYGGGRLSLVEVQRTAEVTGDKWKCQLSTQVPPVSPESDPVLLESVCRPKRTRPLT